MNLITFITPLVALLAVPMVSATEYQVASASEIRSVAGKLKPGDELILKSGTWHDQHIILNANGSEDKPIVIRSERAGSTKLTGDSYLEIAGSYLHLSGLHFDQGSLQKGHVIRVSGAYNKVYDNAITNYNPTSKETRYHWLSLYGRDHTVQHNHFSGQTHSGVTTVVWLKSEQDGHHTISHNYFGPRAYGKANGFETIRIGTGKSSHLNPNVLVAHNLFEGCDGEMEIISNKSNDNLYLFNTFRQSAGTLTIRQGKRVAVAYNHFLGDKKKGTGGVRVIGKDHLVFANAFSDLGGRAEGVISISAGTPLENGKSRTLYPQVNNILIADNRLDNNRGPYIATAAGIGKKKRQLLPQQVLFSSNQFFNPANDAKLIDGDHNDTIFWQANMTNHDQLGYPVEQGVSVKEMAEELSKTSDWMKQAAVSHSCLESAQSATKYGLDGDNFQLLCQRIAAVQSQGFEPKTIDDVGISWDISEQN
ncbi:polysaccharide lyase 6 family protein [Vibrio hippocampi]|uniref:Chondroitinase-B n=1 Tax=Vibrio hippocampi TaxID=654686 RepID=A0ABN8DMU1_9VIBR|nr:polysaccharide lyase 6 family protein [Vibrio hippocampi]CAH0530057.1 Chondroitinase-B [Vibrio hippocampi]